MTVQAPRPEHRWWLSAFLASRQLRLCLLVVPVIILMPPETGLGIELCLLKNQTGAPCPGCGVTRSGANFVRGNFTRAVRFHPFSLILYPVLLSLCVLSIFPDATRRAVALRALTHQRWISALHALFWIAFFVHGLVRWVLVMRGQMTFPPVV